MSILQNQQLVPTPPHQENYFGLIAASRVCVELHGYEVTLEGKLVTPELRPAQENNTKTGAKDVARPQTTLA